jgi:geranylgeranyl diphosphate synthase type II
MDVPETLAARRADVDRALAALLDRGDTTLFRAMRYAVLGGGKRFRPLLLLSAGEALGAERSLLLPFACGAEFIHNYSLVHDDLPSMDDDDLRRGRPSCHKAFGEDVALLAGDGLLTFAFEVMAEASLPPAFEPRRTAVIREFARRSGVEGMVEGQFRDIRTGPGEVNEASYGELILMKTGGLIIASVLAGGLLAGAPPAALEALTGYGTHLGLAFQLRDDVLDAAAEEARPGRFRPNSVALYGETEARRRLEDHVDAAREALGRASIGSRELRALAAMLLTVKEDTGS